VGSNPTEVILLHLFVLFYAAVGMKFEPNFFRSIPVAFGTVSTKGLILGGKIELRGMFGSLQLSTIAFACLSISTFHLTGGTSLCSR
jgi:hypothetical protein